MMYLTGNSLTSSLAYVSYPMLPPGVLQIYLTCNSLTISLTYVISLILPPRVLKIFPPRHSMSSRNFLTFLFTQVITQMVPVLLIFSV